MIQELIITNGDGICFFYYNFLKKNHKKGDFHSIASFLDQINNIFRLGLKENLGIIKLNYVLFSFYEHKASQLHLIFKCDNSLKDTIISNRFLKRTLDYTAKNLMDSFFSDFKDQINNFQGEISQFYSFANKVKSYLPHNKME